MRRAVVQLLAVSTAALAVVACATTGSTATSTPSPAPAVPAQRYKLDAHAAPAGTLQGTLEVRGQRALMVLEVGDVAPRAIERFAGELQRGDRTRLTFDDGTAFDCAEHGTTLACVAQRSARFGAAPLRFERLTLHVQRL